MTDQELRQALQTLLDLWEQHGETAVTDLLLSMDRDQ